MSRKSNLSLRIEDYLTTIYRLEESLGEARVTDIAQELSVRPSTVSKIISKLEERGLVKRAKYRCIELTPAGRLMAEKIIRKHRIAEIFLSRLLDFDELESHIYAHFLEHLPDAVIERIYEKLGKPSTCPHGNPVPGEIGQAIKGIRIVDADIGKECVIHRVAGEFTGVLEYMIRNGIKHGLRVKILYKTSTSVRIVVGESREVELPYRYARFIHVNCEE